MFFSIKNKFIFWESRTFLVPKYMNEAKKLEKKMLRLKARKTS